MYVQMIFCMCVLENGNKNEREGGMMGWVGWRRGVWGSSESKTCVLDGAICEMYQYSMCILTG